MNHRSYKTFQGPWLSSMPPVITEGRACVVPMPFDAQGRGPASPEDTVGTAWELWEDSAFHSLASFTSEELAQRFCDIWNGVSE